MAKEYVFTKSGSSNQARRIESHLVEQLLQPGVSRDVLMAEYLAIRKNLDLPPEKKTVYIITDINPLLNIATNNGKRLLKKAMDLHLPFSGEGLVVMSEIEDPKYPMGYDKKLYAMNSNLPSLELTLHKLGSKSAFMSISSIETFRLYEDLYRPERDFRRLVWNKLANKIAAKTFTLKNLKVWSRSEVLINSEVVQEGVFVGSGLAKYVNDISHGVDHDQAAKFFFDTLRASLGARQKFEEICHCISIRKSLAYLDALANVCSLKHVKIPVGKFFGVACSSLDGHDIDVGFSLGGKEVLDNKVLIFALNFLATAYSSSTKKSICQSKALVLSNIIDAYCESSRWEHEYKVLCDEVFSSNDIAMGIKGLDERHAVFLYEKLGWRELLPAMNKKNKRAIISNELGV